ncbi:hypothetical protein [Ruegeria sp. HKCCSP351]|uniref:hypothetical protein n=1 Tax=Ruegeria sp. HKCCSP351 TaxID=2794832 RepID=UPI001AEABBCB|nr:hypothetical protein [Ruegeria sp. HKCCSP351]
MKFILISICLPLFLSLAISVLIGRLAFRTARGTKESGKEWILPFYGYIAVAAIIALIVSYTLTEIFVDQFAREGEEANLAHALVYIHRQLVLFAVPLGSAIVFAFVKGRRA